MATQEPLIVEREMRLNVAASPVARAGRAVGRGIDALVEGANLIAGVVLLVLVAITCYEVFCRKVLNSPTIWTQDLSVYLFIWLGYLGVAYVEKNDRHVKVDILTSALPQRTQAVWDVLTSAAAVVFMALLVYYGGQYFLDSFQSHEQTWSMWKVLIWPVKLAIPFGGALMAIYSVRRMIGRISYVRNTPLEVGSGIGSKPWTLIAVFLALLACGVYLMTVNPTLGFVAMMFILLFGGVPIFAALGLVGVTGFWMVFGGSAAVESYFSAVAFDSLNDFVLVCLPLFILAGQLLQSGGVSGELYDTVTSWVGHFPAGEAIATILACSVFAAISSSSVATAATIGLIALPALAARKYNKPFSYGLLAAGGTLGIMIPPSGTMIIYSSVTDESLGKLFMAGVIPGLILASGFIVWSAVFCARRHDYERRPRASWRQRLHATKNGTWGILAPLIILGGIYSGVFTPLEAGAVAAAYCMLVVLVRRKVSPRELPKVMGESTLSSVMVLIIIVGALTLGDFMTLMKVPEQAMAFVSSLGLPPMGVIAMLMLIYIILGMFLEVVSCMLITLPIVYPMIIALGFDGIWFAVLMTLNMEMACISPPVGLNLYVIQGITRAPLGHILRGVWPFFVVMCLCMVLFALVPQLSTWLPSLMISR